MCKKNNILIALRNDMCEILVNMNSGLVVKHLPGFTCYNIYCYIGKTNPHLILKLEIVVLGVHYEPLNSN